MFDLREDIHSTRICMQGWDVRLSECSSKSAHNCLEATVGVVLLFTSSQEKLVPS